LQVNSNTLGNVSWKIGHLITESEKKRGGKEQKLKEK
jgi:hypothetical protein